LKYLIYSLLPRKIKIKMYLKQVRKDSSGYRKAFSKLPTMSRQRRQVVTIPHAIWLMKKELIIK